MYAPVIANEKGINSAIFFFKRRLKCFQFFKKRKKGGIENKKQ